MGSNKTVSKKIIILFLGMGWWLIILDGVLFFIVACLFVLVGTSVCLFLFFGRGSNERWTPKHMNACYIPAKDNNAWL